MSLSREQILNMKDVSVIQYKLPDHIPGWGGQEVSIRTLTRREQDEYLKRQFASTKMKQSRRGKDQEISQVQIYGHDPYLCSVGLCDEKGKKIFTQKDIESLRDKNGEAIGLIAEKIVEHSGMQTDVDNIEKLEEEVKN